MSLSVFGSQDAVDNFLYACALGDVQSISDRIRNGFFIDVEDSSGNTALQIASAAGHCDVVELLLRSGAIVNKTNCYGWSALHQAACAGHLRIVQTLVHHGCPVLTKTKYGQTVLALAASGGHVKIINFLLSLEVQWPSPELPLEHNGLCCFSSTLVACAFGKTDVLSALLNADGNVNEKCSLTATTALMVAAAAGHVDCCQVLVEGNADLRSTDCAGRSAAAYAAMLGRKVQLLVVTARGETASLDPHAFYFDEDDVSVADVFDALRADDMELLGKVLSASPSLKNKETIDGNRTLLIEAASSKNLRALKLLLSVGCSVNASASNSGRTPLSHAIENCFEEGVLLLIDAGADPTVKDLSGKSALDFMADRLCKLSQLVIKRMCQAGLAELAPNMLSSVESVASGSMKSSPSMDDIKSSKTLFAKLKAKFKSKPKQSFDALIASPEDVFVFPSSGPLAFASVNSAANNNTSVGGGHLELDPVRVEPLTPPFDRRKLIWTDGAPDDSNASGPPLSSSLKDDSFTVPLGTAFLHQQNKRKTKEIAGNTNTNSKPKVIPVRGSALPMKSPSQLFVSGSDESADETTELRGFLRNLKLGHYESLLKNNEINDLSTFKMLTDRDLREIKEIKTVDRHSLIEAISRAKSKSK